jgi:hypothetical protein
MKAGTRKAIGCLVAFLCLCLVCGCGAGGNDAAGAAPSATADSPAGTGRRTDCCVECHEDHHELWREGGHRLVSCTMCHGFVREHTLADIDPRPEMELPPDAALCLSCHGGFKKHETEMAPKIGGIRDHVAHVSEMHSVRIDFEKTEGKCIHCHDPHSLE